MNLNEMKIKEIKELMLKLKPDDYDNYIRMFAEDTRASVNKLGESLKRQKKKLDEIHAMFEEMRNFDINLTGDLSLTCGIDEVGRGPLAGPVVTAAVILGNDFDVLGIRDSKKLSESKREELYEEIIKKCISYSVSIKDNHIIDEVNILNATKMAMKESVESLELEPNELLIDAVKLEGVSINQHNIIKGDDKSLSIAAASIIAKVTRDRIIDKYDDIYPEYGFIRHKGYGTKEHIDAIREHGPLEIHRKTFIKNFV